MTEQQQAMSDQRMNAMRQATDVEQRPKRPQNCGTGYCSCIECVMEPEQQPADEPVAWLHRMDNTEGIKANGKGIVAITQKRKHPFGKPGVDFSKSYPVTSTPLYTHPQPAAPAIPLTREQVKGLCESAGYDMASMQERADFINGIRHAEAAHAIAAALDQKGN